MAQQPTEPVPDFESSEVRKETFIAEAEKVVRSIGADNLRVLAIADLAGLYTMLGETEAAGVLLEEALQTAREVGDNGQRGKLLAAIALKYAQMGENDIAANLLGASEEAQSH